MAERRCSSCGHRNPERARYRLECGAQVGGASPPAAQSVAIERAPRDYTPRHLSERILRSRAARENERKQVTVRFADVKGSMELAAQAGTEAWHAILERFFEILAQGVHRFDAKVDQLHVEERPTESAVMHQRTGDRSRLGSGA